MRKFLRGKAQGTAASNLALTPPAVLATRTASPSRTPVPSATGSGAGKPTPSATPTPAPQGGLTNTGIGFLVGSIFVILVVAYFLLKRK